MPSWMGVKSADTACDRPKPGGDWNIELRRSARDTNITLKHPPPSTWIPFSNLKLVLAVHVFVVVVGFLLFCWETTDAVASTFLFSDSFGGIILFYDSTIQTRITIIFYSFQLIGEKKPNLSMSTWSETKKREDLKSCYLKKMTTRSSCIRRSHVNHWLAPKTNVSRNHERLCVTL